MGSGVRSPRCRQSEVSVGYSFDMVMMLNDIVDTFMPITDSLSIPMDFIDHRRLTRTSI